MGLFSRTENATISNLKLLDANMSGLNWIGGLVGEGTLTTINEVETSGTIKGSDNLGGIAGSLSGSTISNSYNHATLEDGQGLKVGGIVGYFSGDIINSHNTGAIHGYDKIGGIAGEFSGDITNTYNSGTITGDSSNVGGLIGYASELTSITNSYSSGNIQGDNTIGGLIGGVDQELYNYYNVNISNSFSAGEVTGNTMVGGIIGFTWAFADLDPEGDVIIITPYFYDTNCGWWTGGGPSYALGTTDTKNVTYEETIISSFYPQSHPIYSANPPWDSNWVWSICPGASYPWLKWENRTC